MKLPKTYRDEIRRRLPEYEASFLAKSNLQDALDDIDELEKRMTQLRWFKKDGQEPVLQQQYHDILNIWQDIPTVEEPKKAREFWVEPGNIECRAWPNDGGPTINFKGTKAPSNIIKVREVLDDPT